MQERRLLPLVAGEVGEQGGDLAPQPPVAWAAAVGVDLGVGQQRPQSVEQASVLDDAAAQFVGPVRVLEGEFLDGAGALLAAELADQVPAQVPEPFGQFAGPGRGPFLAGIGAVEGEEGLQAADPLPETGAVFQNGIDTGRLVGHGSSGAGRRFAKRAGLF
ncbi:MAG: hypothetical protein D6702_06425 [Planctomycetota bacterium]|nr:MAG: hypothetical protein D6702_06425 [Planctomycetota bacterium]